MNNLNEIQHLLAIKTEELRAAELRFQNLITHNADGILMLDTNGIILYANFAAQTILNRQADDLIGSDFGFPIAGPSVELQIPTPDGNISYVEMKVADSEWEHKKASLVSLRNISDRKNREQELELLSSLNVALRKAATIDQMIQILITQTAERLHATGAALRIDKAPGTQKKFARGVGEFETILDNFNFPTQSDPSKKLFTQKIPADSRHPHDQHEVYLQLTTKDGEMGWMVFRRNTPFHLAEQGLLNQISGIAASALHRSILFEETNKRMERLSALRDIDQAITSSLDIKITLKLVLSHMQNLVKADAVCVISYNSETAMLAPSESVGIPFEELENIKFPATGDVLGSTLIHKTDCFIDQIRDAHLENRLKKVFIAQRFNTMQAVPMIARGKVQAILLLLNYQEKGYDPDTQDFLHALVTQAAIGLDNATLFEEIQRFNLELRNAYDQTIEGWARAVSLRNQETEQHTRRVAEMAVAIAERFFPFSKSECRDIWYGALLHDIGKIAIPDKVLFKPGPLDADEWVIMKQHPEIAHQMLAPISYLHQALEIPLYHHEHWDGNGYPHHLQGTQIPLSARLFSLIDVWDALTSNRPYRKSWSKEQTLEHIKAQSGKQFDPAIVPIFIEYIEKYYSGKTTPAVLIVDDEPNILRSLERSLREDYDVYTAQTPADAFALLNVHPIQIIIADQRMPEMEGIQLIKEMKQHKPDIVGILLSGYTDTEVLIEALNLGFVRGFIPKPWEIKQVKEKLSEALDYYQLMIALENLKQRNRGKYG